MSYFELENDSDFNRWTENKKRLYDFEYLDQLHQGVEINSPDMKGSAAWKTMFDQISRFNFSIYRLALEIPFKKEQINQLGLSFGLIQTDANLCADEDSLSKISVTEQKDAKKYIPYTNKKLGWHTDGYYNPYHQRVQAFILHCQQSAASGGSNCLLDPDIAYIHLRQHNPDFIQALSRADVMCIPENVQNNAVLRPKTCSAVFSIEQDTHALNMRYSERKFNIIWHQDPLTQDALSCLNEFLDSDSPYIIKRRLNAGEGIICNNVLHKRSSFTDDLEQPRIFYRARYYNRIQQLGLR